MSPAVGAVFGLVIKVVIMMAVALICMLGARLGGNHIVRANPQWSKDTKETAHTLATFAAVVVFAIFVIGFRR
jgi:hypothetical protein